MGAEVVALWVVRVQVEVADLQLVKVLTIVAEHLLAVGLQFLHLLVVGLQFLFVDQDVGPLLYVKNFLCMVKNRLLCCMDMFVHF